MKPLKRHKSLQPLSRDHHIALQFCWKIRKGLANGTDVTRIKDYSNWFFANHLARHFEEEEKFVFPILGNENELIKKAINEHRNLEKFFQTAAVTKESFEMTANALESHIRFEERILFPDIQLVASAKDWAIVDSVHSEQNTCEEWQDQFWN